MNRRFSLPDVHATGCVSGVSPRSAAKFRATVVYTDVLRMGRGEKPAEPRKHGISFEIAALAFEDERCLVRPDRIDERGEQHWHAIGAARIEPGAAVILLVVHVYREETDGEEITRIISARRANKDDFRRYQDQEMD